MRLSLATALCLLAGCGSGVLQLAPDTYRVSTESMSLGMAEAEVVSSAGKHCTALGRQVAVQSTLRPPTPRVQLTDRGRFW